MFVYCAVYVFSYTTGLTLTPVRPSALYRTTGLCKHTYCTPPSPCLNTTGRAHLCTPPSPISLS